MRESARDMPDQRHLEQLVRVYFAAKGEWARLAAEQIVDTAWMSELIGRRRAADDALAAARASLHMTIIASASDPMAAIAEVRWHAAADKSTS